MEGTLPARELARRRGNVRFSAAERADDEEIRRLLRENPTRGRISLTFEREPDYFFDTPIPGETKQTILARENGRMVCMGTCSIRSRFVNGKPRCVGYLGGLRLDASRAGRFDIVRQGYDFFRELQSEEPAEFYFTSIAADNERARHVLERGLPSMPCYEFVGEFVTLIMRTRPGKNFRPGPQTRTAGWKEEAVDRVNNFNRERQFSPNWSVKELSALARLGLPEPGFVPGAGSKDASAAFWDQRSYRQTVIRGYDSWLSAARPALNAINRLLGAPGLPRINTRLANAFVSLLALPAGDSREICRLARALSEVAADRGVELLTWGFASNDPCLARLRRHFRLREYRTRLYVVRWPGLGSPAADLDKRLLAPEVALL
jgi:hypothetical protein